MELFVIRHTEVNNPDNLCYGKYEIPLKNNYKTKTKRIFQKLPNDFDKVYSSPSKRCTDLLKLTAKEFTEIKELHELDFGDWEGKKWDEINQTDLNFWMNDYVNKSPKNGEKMTDLYDRVIEFTENKLPDALRSEAKKLLPGDNYIGFSITQGNEYRPKSWSISKFIELANKISSRNKIPVFFVKKDDMDVVNMIQENVPTAIFPEHKSNNPCPALVTALSKRCELGITIDNGIMHMMGLAKIPLIILFGPTDSKKFAPNYQSVKILDSKKMYNSENLEKISVDDVLKCLDF